MTCDPHRKITEAAAEMAHRIAELKAQVEEQDEEYKLLRDAAWAYLAAREAVDPEGERAARSALRALLEEKR